MYLTPGSHARATRALVYGQPVALIPQQKGAMLQQLAAQCRGTGAVSRDRQKVYFFGLIDVLEKFTIRWRVQRAVLRLMYAVSMRWTSADGISAMPPPLYADRFRTFMAHEVLHLESTAFAPAALDERWRAGRWCAEVYALCRRLLGLPMHERGARRGGMARWQRLWERRRRGLVKQRMASEHEDTLARIKVQARARAAPSIPTRLRPRRHAPRAATRPIACAWHDAIACAWRDACCSSTGARGAREHPGIRAGVRPGSTPEGGLAGCREQLLEQGLLESLVLTRPGIVQSSWSSISSLHGRRSALFMVVGQPFFMVVDLRSAI